MKFSDMVSLVGVVVIGGFVFTKLGVFDTASAVMERNSEPLPQQGDQKLQQEKPANVIQQSGSALKEALVKEMESLKAQLGAEMFIAERYCRPSAIGTITKTTGGKIYTWKDQNGKRHFGDQAPQHIDGVDSVEVEGQRQFFELKLETGQFPLPLAFQEKLTLHINKSYSVLENLLPRSLLRKVQLNLWLFRDKRQYLLFQQEHAPMLAKAGATNGFHSPKDNIAAVFYQDNEQLLTTSVHEAVHVINAGMFGFLPRWLNEGLAEYLEHLDIAGQSVKIPVLQGWYRQVKHQPMPLETLFDSQYEDWQGDKISHLYGQSWAVVFFLMQSKEGKNLITRYLVESAEEPCKEESMQDFVYKYYPGGMKQLQNTFDAWLLGVPVDQQF
ncbi:MAG: DUF1570 domain-containing protein [Cellvibrionaceae bacterium]